MTFLSDFAARQAEKAAKKWLQREGARKIRQAVRKLDRTQQLEWSRDLRTLADLLQAGADNEAAVMAGKLFEERVKL